MGEDRKWRECGKTQGNGRVMEEKDCTASGSLGEPRRYLGGSSSKVKRVAKGCENESG